MLTGRGSLMARRKKEAVHVPANRAEAEDMLRDYVKLERDALEERLVAERAIDRIKADRDALLTDIEAERASLFEGLKAWWEAGGSVEVAGRKRSAELGNVTIGIRKTPPAVKFARKVKAKDVIAWLKGLRWSRASEFLRVKTELDKPAIIKAVNTDGVVREIFASRLTVEQVDEFFIDAGLGEEAARSKIVGENQ